MFRTDLSDPCSQLVCFSVEVSKLSSSFQLKGVVAAEAEAEAARETDSPACLDFKSSRCLDFRLRAKIIS